MKTVAHGTEYEFFFQLAQIEITGRCNMHCKHCRAANDKRVHMSREIFEKALAFSLSEADPDFRVTLSGGEPFLHPELETFLRLLKERGVKNAIITTNGSIHNLPLLDRQHRTVVVHPP